MASTALFKWPLSKSHAATTRQSSSARNDLVFSGPCIPQPMTPTVMRLDGRFWPKIELGTIVGRAMAATVVVIKRRRLMLVGFLFIVCVARPFKEKSFAVVLVLKMPDLSPRRKKEKKESDPACAHKTETVTNQSINLCANQFRGYSSFRFQCWLQEARY